MRITVFFSFIFGLLVHSLFAQDKYKVLINGGDKGFTSHPHGEVELQIYGENVADMMLSTKGTFSGAKWESYKQIKRWTFGGKDGYKSIFIKFKLRDGSVSDHIAEAHIQLDRQPPTGGKISIEDAKVLPDGKKVTNSPRKVVMLKVHAMDAYMIQISNDKTFRSVEWQAYDPSKLVTWRLAGEDGEKEVYVRFRDIAGNISRPVSANVMLDRTPPLLCPGVGKAITINDDIEYTNTTKVKLNFCMKGAKQMFISTIDKWIPYQETFETELKVERDGPAVVEVRFMDEIGNRTGKFSDDILVDLTPPEDIRIALNMGDRYTKTGSVSVHCSAMGAKEMVISNESSFRDVRWQPYRIFLPKWDLGDTEGEKFVFAKFRDKAGNISDITMQRILYDKTPPTNPLLEIVSGEENTNDKDAKVDLAILADEADYMMLSNSESFYKARWRVYKPKIEGWVLGTPEEDGEKKVYIKFRDKAGNISGIVSDGIVLDRTAPFDCQLKEIVSPDGNKQFATDQSCMVNLSIFAREADSMMVSNSIEFTDAQWIPYQENIQHKLPRIEGKRTVYVKFKDNAGNISDRAVRNSIIMDLTPPLKPSVILNRSDSVTRSRNVVLQIYGEQDDYGHKPKQMMISPYPEFRNARWQAYTEKNMDWELQGEDGVKQVYVKFRDEAGNISEPSMDQIMLDRRPPIKGSVKIIATNRLTKIQKVSLEIVAEDAAEMMISNNFDFTDIEGKPAQWETFKTMKQWTLVERDGLKTVFVKFKDAIGNMSRVTYDKIGLDMTPPRYGKIEINENAKYTTNINKRVTLKLFAREAKEMQLSNSNDFAEAKWIPYEYFHEWELEGDDGVKTVFVRFRDQAGNETKPVQDQIILDRQAPFNAQLEIDHNSTCTNNGGNRVALTLNVEDAEEMQISNSKHFSGSLRWLPYDRNFSWRLSGQNGVKRVYARFRDDAGNLSPMVNASIMLDTQAPKPGRVKINGGKTITNDSRVLLEFTATGADYMCISNSQNAPCENPDWRPFESLIEWDLKPGAGRRGVYVRFKDSCGNETRTPITAFIMVAYD